MIDQFADIELVKDGLAKEFVIAMRVKKGPGDVTGKTLSQAGLRGIPGLHPMSVDKADGRHLEATDYSVRLEVSEHPGSFPHAVVRLKPLQIVCVAGSGWQLHMQFMLLRCMSLKENMTSSSDVPCNPHICAACRAHASTGADLFSSTWELDREQSVCLFCLCCSRVMWSGLQLT